MIMTFHNTNTQGIWDEWVDEDSLEEKRQFDIEELMEADDSLTHEEATFIFVQLQNQWNN